MSSNVLIKTSYPVSKIGDGAKFISGYAFKSEDFCDDGVPIIKIKNIQNGIVTTNNSQKIHNSLITNKLDKFVLVNGDILIAMTGQGSVGRVGRLQCSKYQKPLMNQRVGKFIANESSLHQHFLYYVISSKVYEEYLFALAAGSGQPNLNPDLILSVEIPCPPFCEQKEIASILGALDDRITLLRETNATLEAIAQALFKSWFVDFDPVHAKAQGRQPEGMDEQTAALFPDRFVESELGMVPLGWKLVPFGELINYTIGGDWGIETPDEKHDTRVAIIRGTDIPDLQNNTNNRVPVRYTTQKKLLTRKLQDGDIVLEVSGGSKEQPTGRSLYLTNTILEQFDCPVETASFCRLLRPISKDVGVLLGQHLTYIYAQGKTWEYQNQSTGIANFQTTHFLETELVAMPTNEVLSTYADLAKSIISRSHLTQIQQLADLRDTLLPRLISGQLRLPDVEEMVG
jgi:type I restriction enzyme S subunit